MIHTLLAMYKSKQYSVGSDLHLRCNLISATPSEVTINLLLLKLLQAKPTKTKCRQCGLSIIYQEKPIWLATQIVIFSFISNISNFKINAKVYSSTRWKPWTSQHTHKAECLKSYIIVQASLNDVNYLHLAKQTQYTVNEECLEYFTSISAQEGPLKK